MSHTNLEYRTHSGPGESHTHHLTNYEKCSVNPVIVPIIKMTPVLSKNRSFILVIDNKFNNVKWNKMVHNPNFSNCNNWLIDSSISQVNLRRG